MKIEPIDRILLIKEFKNTGWFWDDIFKANIYFLWSVPRTQVSEFWKWLQDEEAEFGDDSDAFCWNVPHGGYEGSQVIWCKNTHENNLIHECGHAASNLFWRNEIAHTEETDELYVLLLDSLYRRCKELQIMSRRK